MQEVNVTDVLWEIQKLGFNINDPHMDGYYQWGQKQKLYQILWEVERQMKLSSTYYGEAQWLEDHSQEQMINTLKGQ
ncbi:hypothetical protein UFOVP71_262 [uncultured Caudovirales phage]|uniref:Uncharacterized protein n=1 Tax=uncultured Caudovirales phage TaxID=2100421 RepID=A0A6J5TBP9_9CAUD|nr:hypothetical protein UFOVP71_262 [uncultured Caudovirales phage]